MDVMIYARQARKEDNGEELDLQVNEIKKYCQERGYSIIKTLSEYRSGSSISSSLLTAIKDGTNVDGIVFTELSRIGRNHVELNQFITSMKEQGIELIFTRHEHPDSMELYIPVEKLVSNL